ncbi:ABC transporter substrate-binding protein [Chloroflexota bacterium]
MKNKIAWLVLSCLMALSLVLASCAPTVPEEEEVVEEEEMVNWWDKFGEPQYGGTITLRARRDIAHFDPYWRANPLNLENLCSSDWKLDRKIYDFKTAMVPLEYELPSLAESWEQPDPLTYIFKIRKGVSFQDIPPVNGRELTAYDVEYCFHRVYGIGSGFTEPSAWIDLPAFLMLESVTATDKYTVVFKWKEPSLDHAESLCGPLYQNKIVPREAIEEWGDVDDWRHSIGTGPFIITDYVTGSVATWTKNPNYWGYDERHPENKLPYADEVKQLIIPDTATALSALRAGKLDLFNDVGWEQAKSLAKTNPEIVQEPGLGWGTVLDMRVDKEPFTDIKVRTAMQMAIDLPTIAATYYGGVIEGIPFGLIGPAAPGWYTPFSDWPKELQAEYTYNPEGAKQLLAEAGYPTGFKTNCVVSNNMDLDLLQILKAYLADINVEMDINVMDNAAFTAFVGDGNHDQMDFSTEGTAYPKPPNLALKSGYTPFLRNYTHNNDPVFNELYDSFVSCLDLDEQKELSIELDMYALEQHWRVNVMQPPVAQAFQPYLKGYSGETMMRHSFFHCPRIWIDQDLKTSMGR